MSNEDVRDFLKKIKKESHERLTNNPFWSVERHEEVCNMLDVAIEALQIEPCEDAVSRQAVLDLCDSKDPDYKLIHFKEDVECLPSVILKGVRNK